MLGGRLGGTLLQSLRKGEVFHCLLPGQSIHHVVLSTVPISSQPGQASEKRSHSLGKGLNIESCGLLVQREALGLARGGGRALLIQFSYRSEKQGPATRDWISERTLHPVHTRNLLL